MPFLKSFVFSHKIHLDVAHIGNTQQANVRAHGLTLSESVYSRIQVISGQVTSAGQVASADHVTQPRKISFLSTVALIYLICDLRSD